MSREILFNESARSSLKKGIDTLARAVTMTLGPRGRAVVIEKFGAPQVTLDGVTVAKNVELENKFENLGAEFLKQAANKTNDDVGDGTTTSVVLAHSMIDTGEKLINEGGFNVIKLSEELKKKSLEIIKLLESQRELINDDKKIQEVATLSSKDKQIGSLIAEVMSKIGKDGVVTIEDSNTVGNSYELVEGMQFDRGYISQYMITNQDKMESVLENPSVLVTDKKISAVSELLPLLEKMMQFGRKELLIICDSLEGEALSTVIVNKLRGVFNILAVKAPGFGDRKKEMLQDIATVANAVFVSEDLGKKLENVEISELGQFAKVISTKDATTLVGGKADKKVVSERVEQLKKQLKKSDSQFDKDYIQGRIGKLSGGVAVIKVGSPTESAQKELKQRVEDAVSATRAAMEEGIVPGGGMALFNVGLLLKEEPKNQSVSWACMSIMKKALEAPLEAIIKNSGEDKDGLDRITGMLKIKKTWEGFNAITNKIEDLKECGIVDPLKVTKTAFTSAVSVASNYLTIGAAMTERSDKDKESFK